MADELSSTVSINWDGVFALLGDDLLKAKAAHRLACGMSAERVGEELGLHKSTIQEWEKEPAFAQARNLVHDNLLAFVDNRMQLRLAQSDVYADFILSVNPLRLLVSDSLKKEILKEQGLMARLFLSKAMEEKKPAGSQVNISQMVLNISDSAARILRGRLDEDVVDVTPESQKLEDESG